jgi:hypothetical protein
MQSSKGEEYGRLKNTGRLEEYRVRDVRKGINKGVRTPLRTASFSSLIQLTLSFIRYEIQLIIYLLNYLFT